MLRNGQMEDAMRGVMMMSYLACALSSRSTWDALSLPYVIPLLWMLWYNAVGWIFRSKQHVAFEFKDEPSELCRRVSFPSRVNM